jgi:hypothetical protein
MQQPMMGIPTSDTVGQFGFGIARGWHAPPDGKPQVLDAVSQQTVIPGIGDEQVVDPQGIAIGAAIPAAPVIPATPAPAAAPTPLAPMGVPAAPKSPAKPAAPPVLLFLLHPTAPAAHSNTAIHKPACFIITTLLLVSARATDTRWPRSPPRQHSAQKLHEVIGFLRERYHETRKSERPRSRQTLFSSFLKARDRARTNATAAGPSPWVPS